MFCKNVGGPRTFTNNPHFKTFTDSLRSVSVQAVSQKFEEWKQKYEDWMLKYEDFIGLTEVKAAQNRVLEAEVRFIKSQEERREAQMSIVATQRKLQDLHAELQQIPKGDDKFLALITREHLIIKDELRLQEEFKIYEKSERENFASLSHSVRDSHEKERAQTEKTKYWSIIGSILGTMLGILGTSINNRMRMKELRNLVEEATKKNETALNMEEFKKDVSTVIKREIMNKSSEAVVLQELPEDRWNDLKNVVSDLASSLKENHQGYLQQHQQLVESLLSMPNVSIRQEKPTEPNINDLFSNQTEDVRRLVMISSIMVPICTWVLCKFVNF